jgi:hypothetical protein
LHVVARLRIAYAAPWFRLRASSQVVDRERHIDAILIAWEWLGFEQPKDFLIAVCIAV